MKNPNKPLLKTIDTYDLFSLPTVPKRPLNLCTSPKCNFPYIQIYLHCLQAQYLSRCSTEVYDMSFLYFDSENWGCMYNINRFTSSTLLLQNNTLSSDWHRTENKQQADNLISALSFKKGLKQKIRLVLNQSRNNTQTHFWLVMFRKMWHAR